MIRSGHVDTFARDALPAAEMMPRLEPVGLRLDYPERLNCVSWLLDYWIEHGAGDRPVFYSPTETWSYRDLHDRVNRIADVLVRGLGLKPGNRVLLRAPNTPMLAACYLAVIKAGGVTVATMPMLRARELAAPIGKARIALALCDHRLAAELEEAKAIEPTLKRIVTFGSPDAEMERAVAAAHPAFTAADTAADDVCLIGFTSGTTGGPKGTMHFHRDVLAIADTYGRHVLKATAGDRFIGSPPLAFTFGLGGLVIFPMAAGASTVLLERATPDDLLSAIAKFGPSVVFTAPTAYRAMIGNLKNHDISTLRCCVSAGEALPKATFDAWKAATGLDLMDGIGATEMLHIFIGSPQGEIRPGATGRVVPGYEARVVDADMTEVPRGTAGFLAVRGPTGCRYLADERQAKYVRDGWNITGDTYIQDDDGYFWYQARSDDMIVTAGYNVSGPEVEQVLAEHAAVAECAVIGTPDAERGMVIAAFVVLAAGRTGSPDLAKELQDHVKQRIAPYKYPRRIEFVAQLPKTATGKLQRGALRSQFARG
jgi:2-aminobenzoate-CoA ligase